MKLDAQHFDWDEFWSEDEISVDNLDLVTVTRAVERFWRKIEEENETPYGEFKLLNYGVVGDLIIVDYKFVNGKEMSRSIVVLRKHQKKD